MQRHGGLRTDELRAFGLDPGAMTDFSASVNPYGPSPRVREALSRLDLSRYPDPDSLALTEEIARRHGVPPDHVLAGNGASELIHLIVRLFVRGGQQAIAFTPTFGDFERACQIAGASIYPWRANPDRDFRWTLRNKAQVLRRVLPPLVYLCNPNNPTGVYLDETEVRSVADGLIGGPMLLDEAYVNFVDDHWDATPLTRRGRVILLRSMTKDYGLAGLRLGYVVAHPDAIAAARRLQPEWSVSAAAQVAGLAALGDEEHLRQTLARLREAKAALVDSLIRHDFPVHAGAANFLLVRTGTATETRLALLPRGIAVRDCTSFGLPEQIRVGVRTPAENARLVDALVAVRQERRQEVRL
ncbi:MAG: histidinol-phosphate transaminase [Dehalococcoidia bacterium]